MNSRPFATQAGVLQPSYDQINKGTKGNIEKPESSPLTKNGSKNKSGMWPQNARSIMWPVELGIWTYNARCVLWPLSW